MLKNLDGGSALTGAALIAAASVLVPIVGNTFKPLAVLGIRGAISIIDGGKTALLLAKEEMEDIVAEAQFERMKNQLEKEINAQ